MEVTPASPAQMTGGEAEDGGLRATSLTDINSFVDSLLSRDDDMIWSFPEFLDDNLV